MNETVKRNQSLVLALFAVTVVVAGLVLWNQKSALFQPLDEKVDQDAVVRFDWSTHIREAMGSDNWPVTWSDDDLQYTSWGDGGGFRGTNSKGRVSFGIAVVAGGPNNYEGSNRFGGVEPDCPATIEGKSYGLVSIKGELYAWVAPGSSATNYKEERLYTSPDKGCTWRDTGVVFDQATHNITGGTFLNFGKDYASARDKFVYSYFVNISERGSLAIQRPGKIYLARVPVDQMENRGSYEWYSSKDPKTPSWGDFSYRVPVFEDSLGVSWSGASVINVPGLNKYILATEHTESFQGNIQMHLASEPWGPWEEIIRQQNWPRRRGVSPKSFFWNFAPKWFSDDGKEFTLVFTGIDEMDSWNTVRGRFHFESDKSDLRASGDSVVD